MRLESVNLGRAEPVAAKHGLSGIRKRPVAGAVAIGPEGLDGDVIVDRRHHGGPDQAVYLYLADDYAWWSAELGRTLAPGTFGENLTISGSGGADLGVGDRLAVRAAVLEVTSHRSPCVTLAARMEDPHFVRRFRAARRPGAYCRVVEPGAVRAGDAVGREAFAGAPVLLTELVELEGRRDIDAATLRRCLAAPLHRAMRADYAGRLARLGNNGNNVMP